MATKLQDTNVVQGAKASKVKGAKLISGSATQTHLRIAEIRDNVLVLKNGGLRVVLETTSVNFNLKSEEEQNAIIYSYQAFLNTLDFPIQIVVRSKKLDLDNYLSNLKSIGEKQKNPLLQKQTFEYVEYIHRLLEFADIMDKAFYVVVPFDPLRSQKTSIFTKFFQRFKMADTAVEIQKRHKEFERLIKGLNQRVSTVIAGLENCGLKVSQLDTSKLVELYYNIYNPITSRNQKVTDPTEFNLA
ncbi:hypothetical protein COV81_05380 [Candidatus Peregrinibacteria bacterium CG11_big_fil_rev_8_21_14_0_20_41_10]|nr:MAG: hypothetical protein COV81_05380 [Candidatus Peregrinibacteria bacterium CG11_big_fil_rev_8_21_14_0_20_41_10]PIZ77146.1 MAG: hypothetical protein COY06_00930 [Candidatus Peregrinibacteria bacterium CG_4_10_14_0_2_um_filter_41_8]PJC38413.1 MAG: hypothetical protein CO045_00190 [Candidatus Peregrinibacteria bacterium CG_4_9_14_0_2_um_filter_41_14]